MKTKSLFFALILVITFGFISCKNDPETEIVEYLITFEDVDLGGDSVSTVASFTSGICTFTADKEQWWKDGIVCSVLGDTITRGYSNECSSISGAGANNSKKFGVVYQYGEVSVSTNAYGYYTIKSVMLNNSTYSYWAFLEDDGLYPPFKEGDWQKVNIIGYLGDKEIGKVDFYLADFRDSNSFVCKGWTKVDMSALGEIDKLAFTFESNVIVGEWLCKPTYVLIDNILFTQEVEK